MSSKPTFTGKDIHSALIKKGFKKTNGKHKSLFLFVEGKKTRIHTMVSHGRKAYVGDLWSAVRMQLGLQGEDDACIDLIKCPLDYEAYVALLQKNGRL